MEFRPCIDIHNGKVKQIVGGSLCDTGNTVRENFVSEQDAAFFAGFYREKGIRGGHIILLNPASDEYYDATKKQAFMALAAYPGGMQVGGGITAQNAADFLEKGASHVIVTSFVFRDGLIDYSRLEELKKAVGKEHVVLDLSCRKKEDGYYIVTDRWQKFTDVRVQESVLREFSSYCDEYLIHAVDVEGLANGIEQPLVQMLGHFTDIPVTYAGGVHSFADLQALKELGKNHVNVTVGSALDLFGGTMEFEKVIDFCVKK